MSSHKQETLITYPSKFPIKVMGLNTAGFAQEIAQVILEHDPEFDVLTIEHRPSKEGNYLGLTATVTATSRQQLDNIYHALTSHPMVKIVL